MKLIMKQHTDRIYFKINFHIDPKSLSRVLSV